MKHSILLYLRLIKNQIIAQTQYPLNLVFDIFSQALVISIYFIAFGLTITRFEKIGGWNLPEVAFLWGLAEMGFGLMDLLFGGFDPDYFTHLIRLGQFDQLLLRPVNITLQVMGQNLQIRRLGRVLQGVGIFIFAIINLDMHWTIWKIAYLPVLVISIMIFFGALFVVGSTIIFWTIERVEAINILTYGGTELIEYPFHIYTKPIRFIFMYVIPFAFISYYPGIWLMDKPDPFNLPAFTPFLAPFIALLAFFLALKFWQFGINHYQSTGT